MTRFVSTVRGVVAAALGVLVLSVVGPGRGAATLPALAAIPYGSACGVFRWRVKTLADPAAAHLPSTAVTTTIAALAQLRAPGDPSFFRSRRPPLETTLYHLRARLQGYVLEEDGDYHLLLLDPHTGQHMIGEIPAPYCAPTAQAAAFANARATVERIGHHVARFRRIWWLDYRGATPPLVDVWGYGFWDDEHGQRGAASNGAELHPVLRLRPFGDSAQNDRG